jgi:hypothetical protein
LDVYPERHKYIAAARGDGFAFLPPDVNQSVEGFSLDKASGKIRVGLRRVEGLGPAAVREIVGGQPYSSFDDFRSRTDRRAVNTKRIETLAAIGAFSEFGIPGNASDVEEFHALGFTTNKPKVFRGCKPKHVRRRSSGSWVHDGLQRNVDVSASKHFCAKLFWIAPPPEDKRKAKILELKSSPWAGVKTWLLTVVDENGIPFHVMVNEDKGPDVKLIRFLANKCVGSVVAVEGSIRSPFLTDGPQGFRLFGVAGSRHKEPQIWHYSDKRTLAALVELDRQKQQSKYK